MYLDIIESSVWLDPLVGVTRISVHVSVGVWGTAIAEESHDLVSSLLVGRQIIPEHCCILQVGLWVAFLGVDEEREFGGIADEEDRCVVIDPIPVTFFCIVFDREPSRVSSSIWGALLATNCRETSNAASLLANTKEHVND